MFQLFTSRLLTSLSLHSQHYSFTADVGQYIQTFLVVSLLQSATLPLDVSKSYTVFFSVISKDRSSRVSG